MAGYKLIYFGVRGKAQIIRYILHDNDVDFEDVKITNDTWPEYKTKMIFGQVPCFYDGNFELPQSAAIVRYLARKHGLYGDNDREAARMDMLYDAQADLRAKLTKVVYMKEGYEEEKQKYLENLPKELQPFEKLLTSNGGGDGYFVGNKISYADYALFDNLITHQMLQPDCLDSFPKLKAFGARMAARKGLAKYIASDEFKNMRAGGGSI